MIEQKKRNLLLTIQYDGTAYHGYQVQQNAISVCEVFQDALEKVMGDRHDVKGCSRTDTGVHALDYKISFLTNSIIPVDRIPVALNRVLPKDIAVLNAKEVPADFHARYDTISKTYVYRINNSRVKNPFLPTQAYFYPYKLDTEILNREIKNFIGTYDFASFCTDAKTTDNTVRTIQRAEVVRSGDMVQIEIAGDGFLRNMVRIIVGTILEIGNGTMPEQQILNIIEARDRQKAGRTAPAHGLFLEKVEYADM